MILVRRLLNFLTNNLIITGFARVAQNTKLTLHAVFVEKDIEERWQIFFETVEKGLKKIKEDNISIFSSLETVMKNT